MPSLTEIGALLGGLALVATSAAAIWKFFLRDPIEKVSAWSRTREAVRVRAVMAQSEFAELIKTMGEKLDVVITDIGEIKVKQAVIDERQEQQVRDWQGMNDAVMAVQRGLHFDRRVGDHSVTVLVVDDAEDDGELTRRRVGEAKAVRSVLLATSVDGSAGLNADVAFLDLDLGESQGVETIDAFRRMHPRMPIVVVSGVDGPPDLGVKLEDAGASSYLSKNDLRNREIERVLNEVFNT